MKFQNKSKLLNLDGMNTYSDMSVKYNLFYFISIYPGTGYSLDVVICFPKGSGLLSHSFKVVFTLNNVFSLGEN